jgi:hypothetical protein
MRHIWRMCRMPGSMPSGLISPARLIPADLRPGRQTPDFRGFLAKPTEPLISSYKLIELITVDRRQGASTQAHTSESSMRHGRYTYASL